MKKAFLLALAVLAACGAAFGQVVVTKSSQAGIGVDIEGVRAGGGAARLAYQALGLDLERSGWLRRAARGQGAVVVQGAIQEAGGRVTFSCQATMNGKPVLQATYTQPAAQATLVAHQAADDLQRKLTGKPSFFLGQLVFVGVSGRTKELYRADASGLAVFPMTRDGSIAVKPRFSPDNRFVSYTSYLKKFPDVYTIEWQTGSRVRRANYPGVNSGGAISPDGRWMALILSKDGNPDLYVKDLASGALKRLTATPKATEGSPVWSPDGSQIAFVSDASGSPQISVVPRNGGAVRPLTTPRNTGSTQNLSPDWGKNGLIAYQSLVGGRFQIAVMDPRSGQSRVITPPDGAAYEDPSWAPDGRHLAASRKVNYQSSIYLLDSEGGAPVKLIQSSGDWSMPAWSH